MGEINGSSPDINQKSFKNSFFYGNVIVAASFLILMMSFGVNYSFGIFFIPLLAEFGWTRAVTSAAYSIGQMVAGLMGIVAGKLGDSFSARVLAVIGGILLGSGCLLMSQVHSVWQMYLFYGVITSAGVGGCYPLLIPVVAKWFIAKRGLVTGLTIAGIGVGILVLPQVANWLVSIYDWRTSYTILGIAVIVLVTTAALFLKRDPRQMGQLPYGYVENAQKDKETGQGGFSFKEATRTGQFWIICAIFLFFGYSLQSIMVHVVPFAKGMGISGGYAASIIAIIGGMSIAGRISIGGLSDKIGVKQSLILVFAIWLAAFLWLQFAQDMWSLYLFSVVCGFAYGGGIAMEVLIAGVLFGLRSLGVLLGTITFVYTIGCAIGPVITGHIFDVTASYQAGFLICAGLNTISLILGILLLKIKPEKRPDQE